MRRIISLIMALLLSFCACGLAAGAAESDALEEEQLSDFGYCGTVYGILSAGDEALAAGKDAKWVRREMIAAANEADLVEPFQYTCENIAALGSKGYQKITQVLGEEESTRELDLITSLAEDWAAGNWSVYECPDVSEDMRRLLKDDGAQYCFYPAYWSETEFQKAFGSSFAKFSPTRPRPGYVCVIIKKGAQSAPEAAWDAEDNDEFMSALYSTMSCVTGWLYDDAPVFTGNPHLASAFWVFNVTYPFYGYYGTGREIKGYDCNISLTVEKADTKKKIAEITESDRLGDTIYSWHDGIARPDLPSLPESGKYTDFIEKLLVALKKERSAAVVDQKINEMNAEKVINGILIELAGKTSDAWQKAIYESGAQDVGLSDGKLSFAMRKYDPKLDKMSAYKDAEDQREWLRQAVANALTYNYRLSLSVKDGKITEGSMNGLKKAVKGAAAAAREAFEKPDILSALSDLMFPAPVDSKVKDAQQLLEPDDSFLNWAGSLYTYLPGAALSPLFYAQSSQKLNTKGGPGALALECVGADPAALLSGAAKEALDRLAAQSAASREDPEAVLLEILAEKAMAEKKSGKHKFTLTLSVNRMEEGLIPADFWDYLEGYTFDDSLSELERSARLLPDAAAQTMPKNGKMTGGSSGAEVRLKLSESSSPTYVQIRRADTGELAASAFILPGKQVSVRVPKNNYRVLYCSGPYWYGEDLMFGDLGSYHKSESMYLNNNILTIESKDGNTTTYKADPSEFRKP